MQTKKDKPLFFPLKKQWFLAFKNGEKDTEFRLYGKRWNVERCYPGREAVLSNGYGKWDRLNAVVVSSEKVINENTDAEGIYPKGAELCAVKLKIIR